MRKRLIGFLFLLGTLMGAQPSFADEQSGQAANSALFSDRDAPVFGLRGMISSKEVENLRGAKRLHGGFRDAPRPWLLIASHGGEADALIELSEFVDTEFAGVIVTSKCYSACAELLMTIKKPVVLGPNADVKFHMNPLMAAFLLQLNGIGVEDCIARRAQWYQENFEAELSATEWTMEVMSALEFIPQKPRESGNVGNCPNFVFQSKGKFYVTSADSLSRLTNNRIALWSET